jgi:catechol 2,3-dioxygenase-like lactoylglutathione lyase family enzyme
VGINHVALEVDDVDRAVAFYGRLFELRGVERAYGGAFLDLGDQFIALFPPGAGEDRHFGLVVDDKERARRVLAAEGVERCPGPGSTSAIRSAIACRSCSTTRSSS